MLKPRKPKREKRPRNYIDIDILLKNKKEKLKEFKRRMKIKRVK